MLGYDLGINPVSGSFYLIRGEKKEDAWRSPYLVSISFYLTSTGIFTVNGGDTDILAKTVYVEHYSNSGRLGLQHSHASSFPSGPFVQRKVFALSHRRPDMAHV